MVLVVLWDATGGRMPTSLLVMGEVGGENRNVK